MQTKEVLDAMKDDNNGKAIDVLKVDGGASKNSLLMQIQADVLQASIQHLFASNRSAVDAGDWQGVAQSR